MKNKIISAFVFVCLVIAAFSIYWKGSIHNSSNDPFIIEVSYNLGIDPDSITQKQFSHRYQPFKIDQDEKD
jgi:hypothetical protein